MTFMTDRCRFLLGAPFESSSTNMSKRIQAHLAYKGRTERKKLSVKNDANEEDGIVSD